MNQQKDVWEETFQDVRHGMGIIINVDCEPGVPFTIEELKYAIKITNNGKATYSDDFRPQLLNNNDIKWLINIFNIIYKIDRIPQKW